MTTANAATPLSKAALLLLVVAGPVLMLPDWISESVRNVVVVSAAVASLAMTGAVLARKTLEGILVALFCVVIFAAWFHRPMAEPQSLRHFAALAAQLLTMGVLAVWCTSERRLALATGAFAIVAAAVLAVGLLSLETADNLKLKQFLPNARAHVTIPIVGTDGGEVNPNALAGTAVLVAPVVMALAVLPRRSSRLPWVLRSCGIVATVVALSLIVLLASRSAWVAAGIAAGALLYRKIPSRRFRLALVGSLLISAAVGMWALLRWHPPLVVRVHELPELNWTNTYTSFAMRVEVWRDALVQLRQSPLLGIGINGFHAARLGSPFDRVSAVPHAHNMFLQVALDLGVIGLLVYVALLGTLWMRTAQASSGSSAVARRIALGGGFALLTVHVFGLGDAIALGAKVGIFQWAAAGLVLAAWRVQQTPASNSTLASGTQGHLPSVPVR